MEKKVNFNFIQRIFNTNKNVSAQNLLNIPIEDKFVKNNIANEKIDKQIDIVLSNSFGFGGTNSALVLKKINN